MCVQEVTVYTGKFQSACCVCAQVNASVCVCVLTSEYKCECVHVCVHAYVHACECVCTFSKCVDKES